MKVYDIIETPVGRGAMWSEKDINGLLEDVKMMLKEENSGKVVIEISEMSEKEFENLPEFPGY